MERYFKKKVWKLLERIGIYIICDFLGFLRRVLDSLKIYFSSMGGGLRKFFEVGLREDIGKGSVRL